MRVVVILVPCVRKLLMASYTRKLVVQARLEYFLSLAHEPLNVGA